VDLRGDVTIRTGNLGQKWQDVSFGADRKGPPTWSKDLVAAWGLGASIATAYPRHLLGADVNDRAAAENSFAPVMGSARSRRVARYSA
jgi:hypothetical protein